jgi:hypothetical protein
LDVDEGAVAGLQVVAGVGVEDAFVVGEAPVGTEIEDGALNASSEIILFSFIQRKS